MKHPTLQKISLTIITLVASFAVGARANGPRDLLSTASRMHGPATPQQARMHMLFPASTYMLDDGNADDAVGLTAGGDLISLNEFAVIPGSETINSISIAWGTPIFFDPSLDGLPYTVVLWSDPNGDGQPDDAVVLAMAADVISSQGTNTFVTTPITPTTVTTPNFFVGFLVTQQAGQFPSAFDETPPIFSDRSFIAGATAGQGDINDLTNNNVIPVTTIESLGLIGNWLIRADAGAGGGGPTLVSAASRKRHVTAGTFDIDLPLTGTPGIEPRDGARNTIVFTFSEAITSVDSAATSCGTIRNIVIRGAKVLVAFRGSCNTQDVTITLTNVTGGSGTLASAAATVELLLGDVNANGRVTRADVVQVGSQVGQPVTSSNFRDDVTLDGKISHADEKLVISNLGTP